MTAAVGVALWYRRTVRSLAVHPQDRRFVLQTPYRHEREPKNQNNTQSMYNIHLVLIWLNNLERLGTLLMVRKVLANYN